MSRTRLASVLFSRRFLRALLFTALAMVMVRVGYFVLLPGVASHLPSDIGLLGPR